MLKTSESQKITNPIKTISSIYYSVSQADGTYNYSVSLSDGKSLSGACGYVTNSQFGKRLRLVVNANDEIECQESNKIRE